MTINNFPKSRIRFRNRNFCGLNKIRSRTGNSSIHIPKKIVRFQLMLHLSSPNHVIVTNERVLAIRNTRDGGMYSLTVVDSVEISVAISGIKSEERVCHRIVLLRKISEDLVP